MSTDPLWTDYYQYDRSVDIISIAEVWFTKSKDLAGTVEHFARFPRLTHPDGNPATPDFTVLFKDGTAIAAELSHLALPDGSLDDLAAQLRRYDSLTDVPSAARTGVGKPVWEIGVLVFVPIAVANAACDRLAAAIKDPDHPYSPAKPPMVLGYTLEPGTQAYTFVRPTRAMNDLLADHGRDPSLSKWLEEGSDTLRGLPKHFAPIKAQARFMNDGPPALYTATVLWGTLLPSYLADSNQLAPVDLAFTVDKLAALMRDDYGFGRNNDVLAALEFLKIARLAEDTGSGWTIFFRDLGGIEGDISQALLHEHRSLTNKARPIRTARNRAASGEDEESPRQEQLLPEQP